MTAVRVRSIDEITAAHDRLIAVILGHVPAPFHDQVELARLKEYVAVLCWVLQHNHNPEFEEYLAKIDAFMAKSGLVLVKRDQKP